MQKLKPVLFFCLIIFCSATLKTGSNEKIQWLKIDEVSIKVKEQSKPVLIDLYTDWCYWCKVMDKKTYTNSKVISYINDHFYPVKLDAETKDIIEWKNNSYNYNENYKVNDFTMYVTSGQPGFPTTVIFTDDPSDPISIQGFLEPKEM